MRDVGRAIEQQRRARSVTRHQQADGKCHQHRDAGGHERVTDRTPQGRGDVAHAVIRTVGRDPHEDAPHGEQHGESGDGDDGRLEPDGQRTKTDGAWFRDGARGHGGDHASAGRRFGGHQHQCDEHEHHRQHRGARGIEARSIRAVDHPRERVVTHGGHGPEVAEDVERDEQRSGGDGSTALTCGQHDQAGHRTLAVDGGDLVE